MNYKYLGHMRDLNILGVIIYTQSNLQHDLFNFRRDGIMYWYIRLDLVFKITFQIIFDTCE